MKKCSDTKDDYGHADYPICIHMTKALTVNNNGTWNYGTFCKDVHEGYLLRVIKVQPVTYN